MKSGMKSVNAVIFGAVFLLMPFMVNAEEPGAETSKAPPAMSKEHREKMAAMHESMATCLRSDKTMEACHGQMQESCSKEMGPEACPMHGGMHGGMPGGMHGGMHGGMMGKKGGHHMMKAKKGKAADAPKAEDGK